MEHGTVIVDNEKSRVSGRLGLGGTYSPVTFFAQKFRVASNLDLRGGKSAINRLGNGAAKI